MEGGATTAPSIGGCGPPGTQASADASGEAMPMDSGAAADCGQLTAADPASHEDRASPGPGVTAILAATGDVVDMTSARREFVALFSGSMKWAGHPVRMVPPTTSELRAFWDKQITGLMRRSRAGLYEAMLPVFRDELKRRTEALLQRAAAAEKRQDAVDAELDALRAALTRREAQFAMERSTLLKQVLGTRDALRRALRGRPLASDAEFLRLPSGGSEGIIQVTAGKREEPQGGDSPRATRSVSAAMFARGPATDLGDAGVSSPSASIQRPDTPTGNSSVIKDQLRHALSAVSRLKDELSARKQFSGELVAERDGWATRATHAEAECKRLKAIVGQLGGDPGGDSPALLWKQPAEWGRQLLSGLRGAVARGECSWDDGAVGAMELLNEPDLLSPTLLALSNQPGHSFSTVARRAREERASVVRDWVQSGEPGELPPAEPCRWCGSADALSATDHSALHEAVLHAVAREKTAKAAEKAAQGSLAAAETAAQRASESLAAYQQEVDSVVKSLRDAAAAAIKVEHGLEAVQLREKGLIHRKILEKDPDIDKEWDDGSFLRNGGTEITKDTATLDGEQPNIAVLRSLVSTCLAVLRSRLPQLRALHEARCNFATQIDQLRSKLRASEARATQLSAAVEVSRMDTDEARAALRMETRERDRLERALADAQNEATLCREAATASRVELETIQREQSDLEGNLKAVAEAKEASQHVVRAQLQAESEAVKRAANAESESEAGMAETVSRTSAELSAVRADFEQQIAAIRASHAAQIENLTNTFQSTNDELTKKNVELSQRVAQLLQRPSKLHQRCGARADEHSNERQATVLLSGDPGGGDFVSLETGDGSVAVQASHGAASPKRVPTTRPESPHRANALAQEMAPSLPYVPSKPPTPETADHCTIRLECQDAAEDPPAEPTRLAALRADAAVQVGGGPTESKPVARDASRGSKAAYVTSVHSCHSLTDFEDDEIMGSPSAGARSARLWEELADDAGRSDSTRAAIWKWRSLRLARRVCTLENVLVAAGQGVPGIHWVFAPVLSPLQGKPADSPATCGGLSLSGDRASRGTPRAPSTAQSAASTTIADKAGSEARHSSGHPRAARMELSTDDAEFVRFVYRRHRQHWYGDPADYTTSTSGSTWAPDDSALTFTDLIRGLDRSEFQEPGTAAWEDPRWLIDNLRSASQAWRRGSEIRVQWLWRSMSRGLMVLQVLTGRKHDDTSSPEDLKDEVDAAEQAAQTVPGRRAADSSAAWFAHPRTERLFSDRHIQLGRLISVALVGSISRRLQLQREAERRLVSRSGRAERAEADVAVLQRFCHHLLRIARTRDNEWVTAAQVALQNRLVAAVSLALVHLPTLLAIEARKTATEHQDTPYASQLHELRREFHSVAARVDRSSAGQQKASRNRDVVPIARRVQPTPRRKAHHWRDETRLQRSRNAGERANARTSPITLRSHSAGQPLPTPAARFIPTRPAVASATRHGDSGGDNPDRKQPFAVEGVPPASRSLERGRYETTTAQSLQQSAAATATFHRVATDATCVSAPGPELQLQITQQEISPRASVGRPSASRRGRFAEYSRHPRDAARSVTVGRATESADGHQATLPSQFHTHGGVTGMGAQPGKGAVALRNRRKGFAASRTSSADAASDAWPAPPPAQRGSHRHPHSARRNPARLSHAEVA